MNVDLDALRAELKKAEARANDLREFIRLATRLYGDTPTAPRASVSLDVFPGVEIDSSMIEPVDAKQATRRLLRESSPREWSADQITKEIARRGWVRHLHDAKPAVGVALSRLHRDVPEIVRTRMGYYAWRDVTGHPLEVGERGP